MNGWIRGRKSKFKAFSIKKVWWVDGRVIGWERGRKSRLRIAYSNQEKKVKERNLRHLFCISKLSALNLVCNREAEFCEI